MDPKQGSAERAKVREEEKPQSYGLKGAGAYPSVQSLNSFSEYAAVSKPPKNQAGYLTSYSMDPYGASVPFAFPVQPSDAVAYGVPVGYMTAARDDPKSPFTVILQGKGFRVHGDTIKYNGGAIKAVGRCDIRVDGRNNIYVNGSSEISVHRCNDIHIVGGGRVSVHRCNNVHVEGGGSVAIHRCNNVRVEGAGDFSIHRCARAQIESSGHARIHRCGDASIERSGDARIHRCSSLLMVKSGNASFHRCEDSAVVQASGDVSMHRCTQARLEGCGSIRIHSCDTAYVGNCRDVQIHRGRILSLDQWLPYPVDHVHFDGLQIGNVHLRVTFNN